MNVDLILISGAAILLTAGMICSFFTIVPSVMISWCGLLFCYFSEKINISYWLLIVTGFIMVLESSFEAWYSTSDSEAEGVSKKQKKNKQRRISMLKIGFRFGVSLIFALLFLWYIMH